MLWLLLKSCWGNLYKEQTNDIGNLRLSYREKQKKKKREEIREQNQQKRDKLRNKYNLSQRIEKI